MIKSNEKHYIKMRRKNLRKKKDKITLSEKKNERKRKNFKC